MTTTNALLEELRAMDDDDLRELAYGVGCIAPGELWDLVLRPMSELYDEVLDARHGDDERFMHLLRCVRRGYIDERDPYFRVDDDGDFLSLRRPDFSTNDLRRLARYIVDHPDEIDDWDLPAHLHSRVTDLLSDQIELTPIYTDAEEDEDIDLLPREDIAAVLADWYADTGRLAPTGDALLRTAVSCEAQERPLDPADVREWADFWLTL